jgi:hypothetical protein
MKCNWIDVGKSLCPDNRDLLEWYKIFQSRQIADLDMLHRYANYYVAALLAMLGALGLLVSRVFGESVSCSLVFLSVAAVVVAHQGKLMAFRFYRRYNEGRMRLSKIEYLLGLHDVVHVPSDHLRGAAPWPQDPSFLIGRYVAENQRETRSDVFIWRRSRVLPSWARSSRYRSTLRKRGVDRKERPYGAGSIIQSTLTAFGILFMIITVGLPIALAVSPPSEQTVIVNAVCALPAILLMLLYLQWYRRRLEQMEMETFQPIEPANSDLQPTE